MITGWLRCDITTWWLTYLKRPWRRIYLLQFCYLKSPTSPSAHRPAEPHESFTLANNLLSKDGSCAHEYSCGDTTKRSDELLPYGTNHRRLVLPTASPPPPQKKKKIPILHLPIGFIYASCTLNAKSSTFFVLFSRTKCILWKHNLMSNFGLQHDNAHMQNQVAASNREKKLRYL